MKNDETNDQRKGNYTSVKKGKETNQNNSVGLIPKHRFWLNKQWFRILDFDQKHVSLHPYLF